MATHSELDERLIRPILHALDRDREDGPTGDHPDEETLARFAQGALAGVERAALVRHLADCAECRQTASLVLALGEPSEAERRYVFPSLPARGRLLWVPIAVAASLLLAGGWLILARDAGTSPEQVERRTYAKASGLLRAGAFDRVRAVIARAAGRGIDSDRLRDLDAQAVRRLPDPIALACAGRLTDFGSTIGGITARGATRPAAEGDRARRALELLDRQPRSADLVTALNRGHALLTLDRPRDALEEFRGVAHRAPDTAMAWLGQGLAAFALDDFAAAASAFRECLRLDPHNTAARLNLAMSLEEQGALDQARAEWERLLAGPLSESDRRAIEAEVEQLRQHEQR